MPNRIKKKAAIDIGTNTMLMLVAEMLEPGVDSAVTPSITFLRDEIRYPRLGESVHHNRFFTPAAMERAMACFEEYRFICSEHGVEEILAVGTSASRDAKNASEFYDKVKEKTGIRVRVISGDQEAYLSFFGGLLPQQDPLKSLVMDIGGGSTEFVAAVPGGATGRRYQLIGQSVDMGSVRATELFLPGDPPSLESVRGLRLELSRWWPRLRAEVQAQMVQKDWTGIAGTPTTLAALELGLTTFRSSLVDGFRLSIECVQEWCAVLRNQSVAQRQEHPILSVGRADIILAGAEILLSAMTAFGKSFITVSSRGLRHGLIREEENTPLRD